MEVSSEQYNPRSLSVRAWAAVSAAGVGGVSVKSAMSHIRSEGTARRASAAILQFNTVGNEARNPVLEILPDLALFGCVVQDEQGTHDFASDAEQWRGIDENRSSRTVEARDQNFLPVG